MRLDTGKPKVVIIGGPTGSGKSHVALKLAEALDGEIVNADSMQVYKYMDIGTAKPTKEERQKVPHHLLDVVEPDEPFNAALYRELALPVIRDIEERGKTCFVVGGTGLYIKVLLGGLFSCPPSDPELRRSLWEECQGLGPERLHKRLAAIDPESASKIHPRDRMRITRALEVYELTKKRPSELAGGHEFKEKSLDALKLCLSLPRDVLYEKINRRAEEMVKSGLVEETKGLIEMGYSPGLKPMKAIGYKHMASYIMGEAPLEEALTRMKRDTRRYAKRQLTWFRGDREYHWFDPSQIKRMQTEVERFLLEGKRDLNYLEKNK